MDDAALVQLAAIDGMPLRREVVSLLSLRSRGDADMLSRMGLGCLSDGDKNPAATCTTQIFRDGPRMFLVPRRDIQVGECITHHYNASSLYANEQQQQRLALAAAGV